MIPEIVASADLDADLAAVRVELMRREFARFVRAAWPIVDPAPLVWSWHLDALCLHLQAVTEGQIKRLIVNIPPGHAKSMIVSVLWPVWEWTRDPSRQMLTASYGLDLAMRDAVRSRGLIESTWFQVHFARGWKLSTDQNVKSYYVNTYRGFRLCVSPTSRGSGWRGDTLTIDDPLSAVDANNKLARDAVISWKTETMSTRFNDAALAREVLIMQRLHEDDLSGFLLKSGAYEHLNLPTEFEPVRACKCASCARGSTSIGWKDPRTQAGELLFPAKFGPEVVAALKTPGTGLGPLAFAGQHQQRPAPAKGNMVQRAWLSRRWGTSGETTSTRREYDPHDTSTGHNRFIVTDAAFKATDASDFVAIGVFDVVGPDLYMIDLVWKQIGYVDSVAAILHLHKKWPNVSSVRIEDRANGPAIIEVLKRRISGVVPIEPQGSKEARIMSAAEFMASGNVWLPEAHSQTEALVEEAIAFPKAAHDDAIDMLAYAVITGLLKNNLTWLDGLTKD